MPASRPSLVVLELGRRLGLGLTLGLAVGVVVAATACAGSQVRRAPGPGAIAGLVRAAATGAGVEGARGVLRRPGSLEPVHGVTDGSGAYYIADLPPGRYEVTAYVASTAIGARTVAIDHDRVSALDFAVGAGPDLAIDLNAPSMAPLWRFRPPGADPETGAIEGTVADIHHERLVGAVVSVSRAGEVAAEQTFTDEQGRFALHGLAPGEYTVSAHYAVVTRAQMEVRRNRVQVTGGEVVVVPLWLETDAW